MGRHLASVDRWINETQLTRRELDEAQHTLSVLRDMVFGEDAGHRSDVSLIRAVGELIRKAEKDES